MKEMIIKFDRESNIGNFVYKMACLKSKRILTEKEFAKAQVRKTITNMFEEMFEKLSNKDSDYSEFENKIDEVNKAYDLLVKQESLVEDDTDIDISSSFAKLVD